MNPLLYLETSIPPTRDGQIQGVENHKDTVELNNTSNELDTRDIYWLLHPATSECTLSASSHGIFTKVDHVVGYKTHLNKFERIEISPGWCSSVDWAPTCNPKGCRFDSQSGHMPGLRARSPVGGVQGVTAHWCFLPLFLPPFPSLKINI